MIKDYMGIISLNEEDDHIKSLTGNRPLAAVPIGGRYRLIDFVLSNMVNAGITNIGIFTQENSRSLLDHLESGKPWDLNRRINGLFLFNFNFTSYPKTNDIYLLKDNIDYLYRSKQNNVIFSSSNMICNLDYTKAINFHEAQNADITIIYKSVNNADSSFINCNTLNLDSNNVISVGKNVGIKPTCNISTDMFIMSKSTLINLLNECISTGYYNSIKDCVYSNTASLNIKGYEFNGYLECINSINSYYKVNMDMLNPKINRELFFGTGAIYTKVTDAPPTKYEEGSKVSNCLIANGCIIEGFVRNSVISRRVRIHKGAQLDGCIILPNCEIKENAKLCGVIIDKNVVIEKSKELKGDAQFPVVIEKNPYPYSLLKHA